MDDIKIKVKLNRTGAATNVRAIYKRRAVAHRRNHRNALWRLERLISCRSREQEKPTLIPEMDHILPAQN